MTEGSSSPSLGDVWNYPFLWSHEAKRGETGLPPLIGSRQGLSPPITVTIENGTDRGLVDAADREAEMMRSLIDRIEHTSMGEGRK